MPKYDLVTNVYPDWFRESLSPLERTWRLPYLFSETQKLFWKKLFFRVPNDFYKIKDGSAYIRTDWFRLLFQLGAPLAIIKIIVGLRREKKIGRKALYQNTKNY